MRHFNWRMGKNFLLICLIGLMLSVLQTAVYADPPTPLPLPDADEDKPYVPPLNPPPRGAFQRLNIPAPAAIISNPVLDMKILVLYDGTEGELGVYNTAIAYLDILGIPYDTINTTSDIIEATDLSDGQHGYYYAVFVTTSNVWASLSLDEQAVLETYEHDFKVRQVTWYAYPSPTTYGLDFERVVTGDCVDIEGNPIPANGAPFNAVFTTSGEATFPYLKPTIALPVDGYCLYGYMASPAAGANVTPLLVDGSGDTFLAVHQSENGREHLVMTMGSYYPAIPLDYIHARLLPYGMINWATRGLFLGERHLYFNPQPDDVFSWGDSWDEENHQYIYDEGYRNEPADLENLVEWQTNFRQNEPNAADFRIEFPFNGEGAVDEMENGVPIPGSLTAKAAELQEHFVWLNHTFTHRDMDVNETPLPDYDISYGELYSNTLLANTLGFTDYTIGTLLSGDYSGLAHNEPGPPLFPVPDNPDFAQAAYDLGIRYWAANASQPGYNNPTPNTGIPHATQPEILLVPRYANNIYYAVDNPAQETDLYNAFYCPGYAASGYQDPQCFDYDEIMESITNQALSFLLDFSVNATMFHMNNLDEYAPGRTLMTDYTELLYGKYNSFYNTNVPILSPRTQEIGALMRQRMAYNASGITGQLACGNVITLQTTAAATIPLTGISYGSNVETYAYQNISYLDMAANDTLVIPGEAARVPAAITSLSAVQSGNNIQLSWPATSVDNVGDPLTAVAYRVYARANDPYFTPTPSDLLAEVTSPTFTHVNGAGDVDNNYTYVVTAIGANCWQEESAISNYAGLPLDLGQLQNSPPNVNYIAWFDSTILNASAAPSANPPNQVLTEDALNSVMGINQGYQAGTWRLRASDFDPAPANAAEMHIIFGGLLNDSGKIWTYTYPYDGNVLTTNHGIVGVESPGTCPTMQPGSWDSSNNKVINWSGSSAGTYLIYKSTQPSGANNGHSNGRYQYVATVTTTGTAGTYTDTAATVESWHIVVPADGSGAIIGCHSEESSPTAITLQHIGVVSEQPTTLWLIILGSIVLTIASLGWLNQARKQKR